MSAKTVEAFAEQIDLLVKASIILSDLKATFLLLLAVLAITITIEMHFVHHFITALTLRLRLTNNLHVLRATVHNMYVRATATHAYVHGKWSGSRFFIIIEYILQIIIIMKYMVNVIQVDMEQYRPKSKSIVDTSNDNDLRPLIKV